MINTLDTDERETEIEVESGYDLSDIELERDGKDGDRNDRSGE